MPDAEQADGVCERRPLLAPSGVRVFAELRAARALGTAHVLNADAVRADRVGGALVVLVEPCLDREVGCGSHGCSFLDVNESRTYIRHSPRVGAPLPHRRFTRHDGQVPEFDIADIMHSSDMAGYVDPVSGEVHTRAGDGFYDDEDEIADDWVQIDDADTAEEYEDMVDFAEAVIDAPRRTRLSRALEGRGAFRRFRDEVHRDGDIGRLWHRFQDARREMRVASWLADVALIPHEESDLLVAARQATLAEVRRSLARFADAELEAVAALERELQTPGCRSNPARLAELLADDFEEVGASGSVWRLTDTLAALAAEVSDAAPIEVHDLVARRVADDLVIVRWLSGRGGRRAERTSLWRRDDAGWRLVHHQGTPVA